LPEVNGHLCQQWNEKLLEHVQIHDTGNGRLHEDKVAIHFSFSAGEKNTSTFGMSRTCSRETRGFSLAQILQVWVLTLPPT
jgi:hypothetical protein